MPDSVVVDQPKTGSETVTTGDQLTQSLGWRAGLPDDLKEHESLKPYKTVGDFAKSHLEVATKAKELEGKLATSIVKPGENATQEERERFQTALGRPAKPEEYEFVGEDKNAPEWTASWKQDLFKLGVPKETAKELSGLMNTKIQAMVDAHNANIQKEISEAQTKLKADLGDKYDASVELAQRLWKKETDIDFDKAFTGESSANRFAMIRFLLKVAAKTGEDSSLRGSADRGKSSDDWRKFYEQPAQKVM
jgi:hypothetical protein